MTPSADIPGFGRPLQPSITERETTAFTTNMMAQLGIAKDSLEMPFSKTDWEATWKYKSSSNNPTLAMLTRLRVGGERAEGSDDKRWNELFNKLVDSLSEKVRTAYLKQSRLPEEERSPNFESMEKALELAASAFLFLENARMEEKSKLLEEQMTAYEEMLDQAETAVTVTGQNIFSMLKKALLKMGHNDPNFDGLMKIVSQAEALLDIFQALVAKGNEADKERWGQLATALERLSLQIEEISLGNKLQMIGPNIAAMTLVAQASALQTGSSALMLALGIAQIGIGSSSEQGGLISPLLKSGLGEFVTAMTKLMPYSKGGSKEFLLQLLTIASLGIAAIGTLISRKQDGFTLELVLNLAVDLGLLDVMSSALAKAGGASEKTLPQASAIISFAALLMLIHVVAKNDNKIGLALAAGLHKPLTDRLEAVGQFFENQTSGNKMSIAVQTVRIALEQEDYENVLQALEPIEQVLRSEKQEKLDQAWKAQQESLKQFIDILSIAKSLMQIEKRSSTNIMQA